MYKLSQRSIDRLKGVHPELVKVVQRAIDLTEHDFSVIEGVRSIETQREYVANGVSKTMNSRHLTGHAVDLYPVGRPTPWDKCAVVAQSMQKASDELGIPVIWGGSWKSFYDGPHFELDRRVYP